MKTNAEYTSIVAQARHDVRIGLNDSQLAEELCISRMTLYKRLVDSNWKRGEALAIDQFIIKFKIK